MNKVLVFLDTNALMMPFQFSIDLEGELTRLLGEYEVVIPSSALKELARLSRSDRKAKAALKLAARYRTMEVEGTGDDAILTAALEEEAVVLTNDRRLRRRLREAGRPVIFLREKRRLEAEGIPIG
ncbi:MAG: PIN domain-containing protein [Thermoplasmata archaeon]